MDRAAVAKAHLVLGRMHVHIDPRGIHFQKKHVGRLPVAVQDIGVGLPYGVRYRAVFDIASIDIQVLAIGPVSGVGRPGNDAAQRDQAMFLFDFQALLDEFGAQHIAHPMGDIRGAPMALGLVVVKKPEGYLRLGQGDAFERIDAMAIFRGFGA